MRLDWALLAGAAEAPPNGLVYILGAGIDTIARDQFPTTLSGAIVLRLVATRIESERPHKVEVHCTDEDGTAVLPQPIMLTLPPRKVPPDYPHGWDLAASIVINLVGIAIPKPGFYNFEVLIDDMQVRTLQFRAVKPPQVQNV
jgi:uncharacterized protein DUF6941